MQSGETLRTPVTWRRTDVLTTSVAINVLTLALPFVILQVYDRILPNVALSTLSMLMIGLATLTVVDVVLKICRAALLSAAGVRFEHQEGTKAFHRMVHSDLDAWNEKPVAHHVEGFRALSHVRDFYAGPTAELTADLPFAFLFLGLIWIIAGSLVVVPLAVLGAFCVVTWILSRTLKSALETRTGNDERRTHFLTEVLEGLHTVKSMAMEGAMRRRYERLEAQSAMAVRDLTDVHGRSLSVGYFFSQLAVTATVVFGAIYVVGSDLTMGGLAACTMLTGRSLRPVLKGMSYWNNYQSQEVAFDQANELSQLKQEEAVEPICRAEIDGALALEHVTLTFDGVTTPILDDVSLTLEPGELVGIVGETGCGKTSLLRLFNGTVKPSKGRVLIDTHPIDRFVPKAMRRQIGYLPDGGTLFEGTILENVAMFREGEARAHAIEVMRFLGLDEFVTSLPRGLDTRLSGANVDRIPGGIKQLLVVARVMVNAPSVILFDHANKGLDVASDAKLLEIIKGLKGGHTILLACARPSYLKLCDRILEMKDGKLVPYELPQVTQPTLSDKADRTEDRPTQKEAG